MGHIRLGRLPRTKAWRALLDEMDLASVDRGAIARNTFAAAVSYLRRYGAWERGCYLPLLRLSELVVSSESEERFRSQLADLAPDLRSAADGLTVLQALAESASPAPGSEARSVLSDLAARAYQETLLTYVRSAADTLWGITPEDVRLAFSRLGGRRGYSELVRHWFGRFVGRSLLYFLDRELSNYVGPNAAVKSSSDAVDLEHAVLLYAHERTQILRDFAPGWLSKTLWKEGSLSEDAVRRFYAYCVKKIIDDFEAEPKA